DAEAPRGDRRGMAVAQPVGEGVGEEAVEQHHGPALPQRVPGEVDAVGGGEMMGFLRHAASGGTGFSLRTTPKMMISSAHSTNAKASRKAAPGWPRSAPKGSAWGIASGPMIAATLPMLAIPPCSAPWCEGSVIRESKALSEGQTRPCSALMKITELTCQSSRTKTERRKPRPP